MQATTLRSVIPHIPQQVSYTAARSPQVVCQLTQLEQLFFSLNPLQALPPAISQLQVGRGWLRAWRVVCAPRGRPGVWRAPAST